MRLRSLRGLCLIPPLLSLAAAHPLHTTLTQVTQGDGAATIWVRAFADDFARGVARRGARPGADPTLAYLGGSVAVWGRDGRRARLAACGTRRSGNVRWFCLRAPAPRGLGGMRILVSLQFAVYDDQVNVVQVDDGRRRASLLFVPGDGAKRIP
jgi:hypothetical protein